MPVVPLLARVGRHDNVTDQDEDVSAVTRLMRSLVPHCGLSPAAATASPILSHDQDLNEGTHKGLAQCFWVRQRQPNRYKYGHLIAI